MQNRPRSHGPDFRADIEGLRAVAVLAVVFFHAGIGPFDGGYVGVDVFFVISGFLISRDILTRMRADRFDVVEFYLRRARRILPSLFVVLALSAVVALLVMAPAELENFAEAVGAASLGLSNVLFYLRSGYFATASGMEPLLHTWSLSVEEQFYLLWPLVIIVVSRFRSSHQRLAVFLALFGLSLIASEQALNVDRNFAFYLLPSRAWELMAGTLAAVAMTERRLRVGAASATIIGAAGLALILAAALGFTSATPFPGLNALLPVAGSLVVVVSGTCKGSAVNRFLAFRPLVFLGRISYPLYLVHWPVLVFWRMVEPAADSPSLFPIQFGMMIGLASLIHRFVEQPIRRLPAERRLFCWWTMAITAGVSATVSFTLVVKLADGLPDRGRDPSLWQTLADLDSRRLGSSPCLLDDDFRGLAARCVIGDTSTQPTVVLWGDSHATQLASAFFQAAAIEGLAAVVITKGGCPPLPAISFLPMTPVLADCERFNAAAREVIAGITDLRTVVLAARWETWLDGRTRLIDAQGVGSPGQSNEHILATRIRELRRFGLSRGADFAIVGVAPIGDGAAFSCARRMDFWDRDPLACMASAGAIAHRYQETLVGLIPEDVAIVDYIPTLCGEDHACKAFDGDYSILLDDGHLSTRATLLVLPALSNALRHRGLARRNELIGR